MSKKVTVYSKPNCVQCNFTKQFLSANEIEYTEINVMEDEKALEHVKSLGFSGLPVVEIDGLEPFNGFRPDVLETLI